MKGLGYLLACFGSRQGPVKPEVLSIQWSGRRSNRRLQRNNSLSPNNPLFSLVSSGGFFLKCFLCLNNSPSPCCVALCLTVIHSLGYPALFLPEAQEGKEGHVGVRETVQWDTQRELEVEEGCDHMCFYV